jgi:CysZ protein
MLIQAAFRAWSQVFSPELRALLWKSLALTIALLALVWFALTRLLGAYFETHDLSADYPVLDTFAFFLAGAGLFIALAYLLPVTSAIVAGYFLDDVAEVVEARDYPADPRGRALSLGASLLYGLRFAGLSLLVNLAALLLFFVPVVNIGVFFFANAYLLGREYFELAAGRFRPMAEASRMRVEHRGTVMLAGAMLAALVVVPVLNLLTPLFGVALMVHVHKRLSGSTPLPRGAEPPLLQEPFSRNGS